ncbi:cohesin subunit SA-3 [Crotalus adamanteus]|uniref:Cohesin subunit SA n=1 Tax=Crotalus adamanteus TaxID=8729 RepID=A0AAW1BTM9_CROAD
MMGVIPHKWRKVRLGSNDLGSQPEVAVRAAGPALHSGEPAPSLDHCKARHTSTIPSPNMKTDPLSDPRKHPPVWDKGRMPSLKEGNNSGQPSDLALKGRPRSCSAPLAGQIESPPRSRGAGRKGSGGEREVCRCSSGQSRRWRERRHHHWRGDKLPAAARIGPAREATAEPKEGSLALSEGNPPTHRGKVPGGRGAGLVFPSLPWKLFPVARPKLSPWKVLASGALNQALWKSSHAQQAWCRSRVGGMSRRKVCGQGRQGQKQQSPVLRPGGREEQLPPTCRIGGPIKELFNIYSESILNEALENIDAGIKVNDALANWRPLGDPLGELLEADRALQNGAWPLDPFRCSTWQDALWFKGGKRWVPRRLSWIWKEGREIRWGHPNSSLDLGICTCQPGPLFYAFSVKDPETGPSGLAMLSLPPPTCGRLSLPPRPCSLEPHRPAGSGGRWRGAGAEGQAKKGPKQLLGREARPAREEKKEKTTPGRAPPPSVSPNRARQSAARLGGGCRPLQGKPLERWIGRALFGSPARQSLPKGGHPIPRLRGPGSFPGTEPASRPLLQGCPLHPFCGTTPPPTETPGRGCQPLEDAAGGSPRREEPLRPRRRMRRPGGPPRAGQVAAAAASQSRDAAGESSRSPQAAPAVPAMAPPSMALRRRPAPASAAASAASSSSSSSSAGSAAASGEPGRGAGWDSGSDVEAEAAVGRRAKRPARRRGSPVPKRARPRASEEAGSAGGLFEAVKAGRSALEPLVDEWLEGYRRDRPGGFAELLNFVVRACGCRGVVTLEMLRGLQNSEIIKSLTESFEEDSAEYPLLLNTPTWRRFRAGFCEFIAVLVHRAQHNVVYDEYLMDSLIAFLTGMSDSQVRAFRHTSTLAAMKLMTALVHVALSVTMQKDNAQRQYETERAKGLGCWAPGKLEGLLEKHKEFQEKQEELETLMNALFKGVFVHRYRDLIPEIRAICIGEMGEWIQHYATSFLTDGYLKYIGWTLHDKQGEVRLRCLLALQGLYGSPETALQMELFTGRFKERIVSMVLDKEPQVAAEAVRLLTLILQNTDGALTDADCERVFPLVYASSRPVAAAAGEFLYKKLLAPKVDARGKSGDRHEATRVFLQWLLVFFIESEFHDHAAYLVDSLWDSASALLKDWQVPTGLLLEESPVEGLGDLKESSLILILVASMRQATEGHPPIGRFSGKKVFSARERKAQSEERLRLTQHFVPLLPQLLAKFSADAEKVGPLLEALRYFDLTYYSTGRLEKHLDLLLTQLKEVVEKHTGREVLELASQTLQLLCCTEFAFYSRVDLARSCIMDYLADKFQHDVTELLQSSFSEQEEVYSMATTLRRIAFFHSAHDLTPWGFFQPCVHLLRHLLNTGEAYEQVVIPALTCAHFSLLWELSRCSAGAVPDQQQLLSLKDKVAAFCSLCQSCLVDVEPCVQEQAFVLLSDLLLIFGPQLTDRGHPVLQELVFQPESALQSQLSGFLMDRVFNHSQAPEDGVHYP